jgi:hypothetical protein
MLNGQPLTEIETTIQLDWGHSPDDDETARVLIVWAGDGGVEVDIQPYNPYPEWKQKNPEVAFYEVPWIRINVSMKSLATASGAALFAGLLTGDLTLAKDSLTALVLSVQRLSQDEHVVVRRLTALVRRGHSIDRQAVLDSPQTFDMTRDQLSIALESLRNKKVIAFDGGGQLRIPI